MSLLPILFWVILALALLGVFVPPTWPNAGRISSAGLLVLILLLGLRVFPISLQ